jgi:hypothetical protein
MISSASAITTVFVIANAVKQSSSFRPFGFAIRMLEYKDLQSELPGWRRKVSDWRRKNPTVFVIVSLRTIQNRRQTNDFWIVRKLTMKNAVVRN